MKGKKKERVRVIDVTNLDIAIYPTDDETNEKNDFDANGIRYEWREVKKKGDDDD